MNIVEKTQINPHPPLQESWLKKWLDTNTLIPQIDIGFGLAVQRVVIHETRQNPQLWHTLVDAYIDTTKDSSGISQLDRVKEQMAIAHKAFRKNPRMPEGYPHTEGQAEPITDQRLQNLWRSIAGGCIPPALLFSNWAEHDIPQLQETLTPAKPSRLKTFLEATMEDNPIGDITSYLTQQNAKRLTEFFADPRSQKYLEVMERLYIAAENAMGSDWAKTLARVQRDKYLSRKKSFLKRAPLFLIPTNRGLFFIIKRSIQKEANAIATSPISQAKGDIPGLTLPQNLATAFAQSIFLHQPVPLAY